MAAGLPTIRCSNISNRPLTHHRLTYGLPLAAGAWDGRTPLQLRGPANEVRPVQSTVLESAPDGSPRWVLLDFTADLDPNEQRELTLEAGAAEPTIEQAVRVDVDETTARLVVTTPTLRAEIPTDRFALFASYQVNGKELIAPGSDIIVEALGGKTFRASGTRALEARVLASGPLRATVEVTGRHTADDGDELLEFRVRYTFGVHEPGVMLSYKMTNREAPETGVELGAVRMVVPTALDGDGDGDGHDAAPPTTHVRQAHHGTHWWPRPVSVQRDVEITAGGAVNEAAKARYGSAADSKIVIRDLDALGEDLATYPHFLRPGNPRTDMSGGLRQVFPYLAIESAQGSAVGWFYEMGQNFPKGLRVRRHELTFDVWPSWAGALRLRRGMSKEHDAYVALFGEPRGFDALESLYLDHELMGLGLWANTNPPVEVTLDPEYAREVEALDLHRWLPYDEDQYPLVEMKMGSLGFSHGAPQMGMLDYGDFVSGDRSWCHNNENDAILQHVREYYRKRDYVHLLSAAAKARHNAHVDFIAHDPDPLRHGTMPAHCPEHTDGATYPSHMWVEGLLGVYCVTGDADFRDAAISVGENMLRWQEQRPGIFYADSRECGWPMLAWVRLWDHTHEQRWLDACHEVFEFYQRRTNDEGQILYDLPHGMGFFRQGYGEFIAWRALFFYYERTGDESVREFLVRVLPFAYQRSFTDMAGGWGANDLFPAWAGYQLTGDDRYIEDNYPFLRVLMRRPERFAWSGVDVMYYFHELHRRGVLAEFQS